MKKFLKIAVVSLCFITADSFAMQDREKALQETIGALVRKWNFLRLRIEDAISERKPNEMFASSDPCLIGRLQDLCCAYNDKQILQMRKECDVITPQDLFNFWYASHNMTVSTQNISFEGQMRLYSQWKCDHLPLLSSSAGSSSAAAPYAAAAPANTVSPATISFTTLEQAVKAYAKTDFVFGKSIDEAWGIVRDIQRGLGNELQTSIIDDGHMKMMIESALKHGRSLESQKYYFIEEWQRAHAKFEQHTSYASSSAGSSAAAASASPTSNSFLPDKKELGVVVNVYGRKNNIQFALNHAEDIRVSLGMRLERNPNNEELAQLFAEAIDKKCRVEVLMEAFVQRWHEKKPQKVADPRVSRASATPTDTNFSDDFRTDQDDNNEWGHLNSYGGSTSEHAKFVARFRNYVVWGAVGVAAVALSALVAVGAYWYFFKDAKKEEPVVTT
jgi:hypothetical protein